MIDIFNAFFLFSSEQRSNETQSIWKVFVFFMKNHRCYLGWKIASYFINCILYTVETARKEPELQPHCKDTCIFGNTCMQLPSLVIYYKCELLYSERKFSTLCVIWLNNMICVQYSANRSNYPILSMLIVAFLIEGIGRNVPNFNRWRVLL